MMYPSMPLVGFIACCSLSQLALKLLNNVAVSLLTLSLVLPWSLLVIHAPYELALAMYSFIIMPSYCWMPSHAMKCFVMSDLSSQRGLHIIISAMLCFLLSLKPDNETCYVYMLAIISSGPFWLMVSKGLLSYAFNRILSCLVLPC